MTKSTGRSRDLETAIKLLLDDQRIHDELHFKDLEAVGDGIEKKDCIPSSSLNLASKKMDAAFFEDDDDVYYDGGESDRQADHDDSNDSHTEDVAEIIDLHATIQSLDPATEQVDLGEVEDFENQSSHSDKNNSNDGRGYSLPIDCSSSVENRQVSDLELAGTSDFLPERPSSGNVKLTSMKKIEMISTKPSSVSWSSTKSLPSSQHARETNTHLQTLWNGEIVAQQLDKTTLKEQHQIPFTTDGNDGDDDYDVIDCEDFSYISDVGSESHDSVGAVVESFIEEGNQPECIVSREIHVHDEAEVLPSPKLEQKFESIWNYDRGDNAAVEVSSTESGLELQSYLDMSCKNKPHDAPYGIQIVLKSIVSSTTSHTENLSTDEQTPAENCETTKAVSRLSREKSVGVTNVDVGIQTRYDDRPTSKTSKMIAIVMSHVHRTVSKNIDANGDEGEKEAPRALDVDAEEGTVNFREDQYQQDGNELKVEEARRCLWIVILMSLLLVVLLVFMVAIFAFV